MNCCYVGSLFDPLILHSTPIAMIYEWFSFADSILNIKSLHSSTCKALQYLNFSCSPSPSFCLDIPSTKLKNCKANFFKFVKEMCARRRIKRLARKSREKMNYKSIFTILPPWWTACLKITLVYKFTFDRSKGSTSHLLHDATPIFLFSVLAELAINPTGN